MPNQSARFLFIRPRLRGRHQQPTRRQCKSTAARRHRRTVRAQARRRLRRRTLSTRRDTFSWRARHKDGRRDAAAVPVAHVQWSTALSMFVAMRVIAQVNARVRPRRTAPVGRAANSIVHGTLSSSADPAVAALLRTPNTDRSSVFSIGAKQCADLCV